MKQEGLEKKAYIEPKIKVITLEFQGRLLDVSGAKWLEGNNNPIEDDDEEL
ncbi:hypothetical protein JJE65_02875 [Alloprevotella tannerae]|uniref:hypothetical protein n=1 Tax=Alloprevotella tannerae TaxID=76122 RepID=UPI001EDC49E6|nr:hypothetical protein [Alloprevotella tannerae]MCG2648347.1 hypothetical protein [Alloprevotella tannerae]